MADRGTPRRFAKSLSNTSPSGWASQSTALNTGILSASRRLDTVAGFTPSWSARTRSGNCPRGCTRQSIFLEQVGDRYSAIPRRVRSSVTNLRETSRCSASARSDICPSGCRSQSIAGSTSRSTSSRRRAISRPRHLDPEPVPGARHRRRVRADLLRDLLVRHPAERQRLPVDRLAELHFALLEAHRGPYPGPHGRVRLQFPRRAVEGVRHPLTRLLFDDLPGPLSCLGRRAPAEDINRRNERKVVGIVREVDDEAVGLVRGHTETPTEALDIDRAAKRGPCHCHTRDLWHVHPAADEHAVAQVLELATDKGAKDLPSRGPWSLSVDRPGAPRAVTIEKRRECLGVKDAGAENERRPVP